MDISGFRGELSLVPTVRTFNTAQSLWDVLVQVYDLWVSARMILLLEHGQLLKPYTLAWRPGGHVIPKGWTPKITPDIATRADELQEERPEMPRFFAEQQAAAEHGLFLNGKRLPWTGWFPIHPQRDRGLSRAYRRLFQDMNEGVYIAKGGKILKCKERQVEWPSDGFYQYKKGKLVRLEEGTDV